MFLGSGSKGGGRFPGISLMGLDKLMDEMNNTKRSIRNKQEPRSETSIARGAFGAARKFFDLVVLVCSKPRRPSAGMVDSNLVLLGQKI